MNSLTLLDKDSNKIDALIQLVTVQVAETVANVKLRRERSPLDFGVDMCTVYTSTKGAYQMRLVLCAEKSFLLRIAEHMLGEPISGFGDIEEAAKEFFNILCGHIVGEIARQCRVKAMFTPPSFVRGSCFMKKTGKQAESSICFVSSQNEKLYVSCDQIPIV